MPSNRELFYRHLGMTSPFPMDLEFSHASGVWLYTPAGEKYLDLVSGVSVSNVGHCNPEIVKAISEQASRYMHLMVYGEFIQQPQTDIAEKLSSILPSTLNNVYLVNSGSEAIEGAMKLAKRFTGRQKIAAMVNAYHGGTHGALSLLGNEEMKYAFRPLLPGILRLRFNSEEDLNLLDDQVAAVFVEPVQAEAGVILPNNDYLKRLREICTEKGILLVFDEIQTGLGRTGTLFYLEQSGVVPDVLCLAKALGGGMPLGAFIADQKIMSSLTHDPILGHITTFGGHPVSCAAANAALNILTRDKIYQSVEDKARLFYDGLIDHPLVKEIRNVGLLMAVDMPDPDTLDRVFSSLTENKILTDRFLFKPEAFRIAPPLTITVEEIEIAIKTIRAVMDSLL